MTNGLLETLVRNDLARDVSPVGRGGVRSLVREPFLPQPLVGILAAENSCPMVPEGLGDVGGVRAHVARVVADGVVGAPSARGEAAK